jgi:sensor domain DACND-containing protein/sensor domain DACNH-containing protein/DisA checkpoint controller-like protein
MGPADFTCKCIAETIDGLSDGLSHFSGLSRTAVIYALRPHDSICIYDPQNLLRGHEPKLKELYLENPDWLYEVTLPKDEKQFGYMLPQKNLGLTGLISFGGRSGSVFYQMWFTEHHPDMCSISPTERWLEHAAWRFAHDMANDAELYTGISGSFLREYAHHAIRDAIVDEMNIRVGWDTDLRVYPILDAILEISRTREEGAWPRGKLLFAETRMFKDLLFVARFPEAEQLYLSHHKHVRKLLLAVENSSRILVSNGKSIVGIARRNLPAFSITADFKGRHGFLKLDDEFLCSFSDGSFKSTTHRANLVQLEEALLETDLDSSVNSTLFKTVSIIVHHAGKGKHGCTLVIDLNTPPLILAGQRLNIPLDLREPHHLALTKSLSKVDGAIHVTRDIALQAFACLLDGHAIAGEDRSRGARHNSALRFTAAHDNIIVVVVSTDRRVSVIQGGVELSAQFQWRPVVDCAIEPETLETWIESGE